MIYNEKINKMIFFVGWVYICVVVNIIFYIFKLKCFEYLEKDKLWFFLKNLNVFFFLN